MTGFEWHTADENEAIWQDTAPGTPAAHRPFWLQPVPRLIGVILLGAVLAYLIQDQVRLRLAAVEAAVQADIVATGELLQEAAGAGDVELFTTMLSGRDPDWTAAQQAIVAQRLLLDRPALNLRLLAETGGVVTTTLSANLQAAEQVARYDYVLETPSGENQTITLQQIAVFRQGAESWLYAPPDEAFWGPWRVAQGDHLMITFPERDDALARRLLADLDRLVTDLCALPAPEPCRPGRFLWVRFSPDLQSLLRVERPDALVRTGRRLELPAPTLVGRPVDDRGYRALLAGYAPFIAARVVAGQVQWQCCLEGGRYPGALVFQALLREYLHRLAFIPQPPSPAAPGPQPAGAAHLAAIWSVSPPHFSREELDQAQIWVAHHLAGESNRDLLNMMQTVGDRQQGEDWVLGLINAPGEPPANQWMNATINNE